MKILKYILYLYLLIASLFAIKFNYDYARENTFIDWLLFGEIKPTLQGLVWPHYILNEEKNEINKKFNTQEYFQNSINDIQKAFRIEEQKIKSEIDLFNQKDEYSKAIELRRKALKNAVKVSIDELRDNLSNEIANSYKNDFIKGLKLYFQGLENENKSKINSSTLLINNFGKIYSKWRDK